MLHIIKDVFPNPNESRLNTGLMNREYDRELSDQVVECFQSIESVLDEITMTSHHFTTDPNEINMVEYQDNRETGKKVPVKIAMVQKSLMGELTMNFLVTLPEDMRKAIAANEKLCKREAKFLTSDYNLHFRVRQLVPLVDETGRYLLNGVRYARLYQLTEASTYITPSCDVLKSVMPVMVKRGKYTAESMDGTVYKLNNFKVLMLNSFSNVMQFFLASMGWDSTLEFFRIYDYISIVSYDEDEGLLTHPKYVDFKLNDGVALRVYKIALSTKYIQGIVGTFLDVMTRGNYTYEQIMDKNTWIKRIGITKKKVGDEVMLGLGKKYLILFKRMYSTVIQRSLRLNHYNKKTIYSILRWMIQHYDEIREKDNLDYNNKRLRDSEQIASLINESISSRIKTLISTETDIPEKIIDKYKRFFNWDGRELISRMHFSDIVRTEDAVNDMDMFSRLKYTKKGANALGNKNSRNISAEQRAIHPSEIGKDSPCTCSAGEPGLANFINFLCETDGLYFKDSNPEPESFWVDFLNEIRVSEGKEKITDNNSFILTDPNKFAELLNGFDDEEWDNEELL